MEGSAATLPLRLQYTVIEYIINASTITPNGPYIRLVSLNKDLYNIGRVCKHWFHYLTKDGGRIEYVPSNKIAILDDDRKEKLVVGEVDNPWSLVRHLKSIPLNWYSINLGIEYNVNTDDILMMNSDKLYSSSNYSNSISGDDDDDHHDQMAQEEIVDDEYYDQEMGIDNAFKAMDEDTDFDVKVVKIDPDEYYEEEIYEMERNELLEDYILERKSVYGMTNMENDKPILKEQLKRDDINLQQYYNVGIGDNLILNNNGMVYQDIFIQLLQQQQQKQQEIIQINNNNNNRQKISTLVDLDIDVGYQTYYDDELEEDEPDPALERLLQLLDSYKFQNLKSVTIYGKMCKSMRAPLEVLQACLDNDNITSITIDLEIDDYTGSKEGLWKLLSPNNCGHLQYLCVKAAEMIELNYLQNLFQFNSLETLILNHQPDNMYSDLKVNDFTNDEIDLFFKVVQENKVLKHVTIVNLFDQSNLQHCMPFTNRLNQLINIINLK